METSVWVALIGAFITVMTSVFVPIVMARLAYTQKIADRDAEWKRQDELEERVKNKAKEVEVRVKAQAAEVAETASTARQGISDKLDVIHTLVNGKATEAMKAELTALNRELELRRQVKALKTKYGEPHNSVGLAAIDLIDARIAELQRILGDKLATDKEAEELAAAQKSEDNK